MLRMSKLADYGTVILTTMVREPQRIQSAAEIAARIHVAIPTVSKILKILTSGGLVTSMRGARGGYLLARSPAQISVAQIIEVMDGPIGMTECSITPGLCTQESECPVRANWQKVNQVVLQALQQVSLAQMVQPVAAGTVDISGLHSRRPAGEATAANELQGEKS
jgi:FeS assembly SUF system regulator